MNRKVIAAALLLGIIFSIFALPACKKQTPADTTAATTTATSATTATVATSKETTSTTTSSTAASTEATATTGTTAGPTEATTVDSPGLVWSVNTTTRSFLADDSTAVLTVICSLPGIVNPGTDPAGKAINSYFSQLSAAAISEAAELAPEAIDAYNSMGDFFPWSVELTGEVIWRSADYASTTTLNYYYYGGAHPNSKLSSACFNLQTGKLMALGDFFTIPEHEVVDLLVGLIYEQTSTIMDESGSYPLYDCSEEQILNSFLPEHYYLTENGLVLYFQPYDIAPYAAGLPQFLIPYARLKDVTAF